jgi:hypothetical protein
MGLSGEVYGQAAQPSEKDPAVPIGYAAEWAPEPVWTEKSLVPHENVIHVSDVFAASIFRIDVSRMIVHLCVRM